MARRGRTCVVEGCERKAAMGSVVCQEHRDSALGEQTDREIVKMTQRLAEMAKYEEGEEKRDAVRTFRRQVARGDYAALFSSEMMNALNEEGRGFGLQTEIGMMRVAMLRLMLEEENPSRMAHGLAKLSGALGKSMERQAEWDKAARQARSYQQYLAAARTVAPVVVDEPQEAHVADAPMDVAEEDEALEIEVRVVEDELPVGQIEAEPVGGPEWPRTGYPDYYIEVEELAVEHPRRVARGK